MTNIQQDYYANSPLTRIVTLERRVAALERALSAAGAGRADADRYGQPTDALPNQLRPTAGSFPDVYVIERQSGDIYRLEAEAIGGSVRLRLVYVGPTREGE